MTGSAVAVHTRPYGVLLAAADGDGVRLLAAAPPGTSPVDAVGAFFGDGPPDVVVRVGATPGGPFPGAPRVVAVPVAVAVLAVGPEPPAGPVLVVHAGDARVETTVVDDGAVVPVELPVAHRGAGAPGDRPPGAEHQHPPAAALAALADRTRVVELVLAGEPAADDPGWGAAVAAATACPVRIAGPLVADDPAGVPGAGPDTAAVLGAALLGAGLCAQAPVGAAPSSHAGRGEGPAPARADDPADHDGPDRLRWALPVVALLGALLVVAGWAVGDRAPVVATGVVQYGYAAALPAGWEHTGGDPARRRTLLTPAGRPGGTDLVVVERSPLPYDAGREPARARRELAALLAGQDRVAPPGPAVVAGRAVLRYTQHPGDGAVVDWHVLFESDDQLVVGCRRAEGAAPLPACTEVVGSVRRVP